MRRAVFEAMRRPIDDERARSAIDTMRALAFAAVTAPVAGAVVWICCRVFVEGVFASGDGDLPPVSVPPPCAWGASVAGAALAGWATRRERDVHTLVYRACAAGLFAGPVLSAGAFFGGALVGAVDAGWSVLCTGLCGWIVAAPLGIALGAVLAIALTPMSLALARLCAEPTLTTVPRALRVTAGWLLVLLVPVAAPAYLMPAGLELTLALGLVALAVVVGASVEIARRTRLARAASAGELAGWSVERDDEGTHWLTREHAVGEGAYRARSVRVRWARLES